MRNIISIAFALFCLFSPRASAQNMDQYAAALKSGNVQELSKSFLSNVEISVKETGNSYSKTQAEQVLSNFFSKNPPKNFTIVHQGTSPEGSKYFVGNLVTGAGNYRVYLYAKQNGNAFAIREIRFELQ